MLYWNGVFSWLVSLFVGYGLALVGSGGVI